MEYSKEKPSITDKDPWMNNVSALKKKKKKKKRKIHDMVEQWCIKDVDRACPS